MERSSYNPVDQFDADSTSYTSMIYLGILPYSFNFAAQKFLSGSNSILQSIFSQFSTGYTTHNRSSSSSSPSPSSNDESISGSVHTQPNDNDDTLVMDEVAMVLNLLGLPLSNSEIMPAKLGRRELSQIFDEREPSLDEVKAAFDVFDVNRDGFIDAVELGRVLTVLGLTREESDVEGCRRMIDGVDEDGDGMIGFSEFLKFMQKSFC